jgi:hypothetical protein
MVKSKCMWFRLRFGSASGQSQGKRSISIEVLIRIAFQSPLCSDGSNGQYQLIFLVYSSTASYRLLRAALRKSSGLISKHAKIVTSMSTYMVC